MNKIKAAAAAAAILLLGGCTYSVEVNEKSYVIAIGIDKGSEDMLKVSFLFANPASGSSEDGGGEEKEKDLVTLEAPGLYSAMNMLNTFKSKQIDISHTKLVVFSEKAARNGINSIIADMVNTRGFRPSIYVCVCQGETEKLFKAMKPKQEEFIEKYIENLFSKSAGGNLGQSYLYNYYFNVKGNQAGALLPLAGLTDEDGAEGETQDYPYEKIDDLALNYTADEIPLSGNSIAAVCGYAVFDGEKMVGTLGMAEGRIVDMLKKNLTDKRLCVLIPEKNKYANITLRQNTAPCISVRAGEQAQIDIKIRLSGEFTGVSGIFETREDYAAFTRYLNSALEQKANDLIYRTQNEFGVDVLGLGEKAKRRFLTNKQWEDYNWRERYKSARVNVSVNLEVNDFGELKYEPEN